MENVSRPHGTTTTCFDCSDAVIKMRLPWLGRHLHRSAVKLKLCVGYSATRIIREGFPTECSKLGCAEWSIAVPTSSRATSPEIFRWGRTGCESWTWMGATNPCTAPTARIASYLMERYTTTRNFVRS